MRALRGNQNGKAAHRAVNQRAEIHCKSPFLNCYPKTIDYSCLNWMRHTFNEYLMNHAADAWFRLQIFLDFNLINYNWTPSLSHGVSFWNTFIEFMLFQVGPEKKKLRRCWLTAALTCPLELPYRFRCLMNSDLEVFPTAISAALPFANLLKIGSTRVH